MRPSGTAQAATSAITPRWPPAAWYRRPASHTATMTPATRHSAYALTGIGPSCHTPRDGLGMYAIDMVSHTTGDRQPASPSRRAGARPGRADARGQLRRQAGHGRDPGLLVRGLEQPLHERGADDHAVGVAAHRGRLGAVPHAEADRDRQGGDVPDPADQRRRLVAHRVADPGHAHPRGRVDEAPARQAMRAIRSSGELTAARNTASRS